MDPIFALTQACVVKGRRSAGEEKLDRALDFEDGTPAGMLPPITLGLDPKRKVDCQSSLDLLPIRSLSEGEYVFRAAIETDRKPIPPAKTARFSIIRGTDTFDKSDHVPGTAPH